MVLVTGMLTHLNRPKVYKIIILKMNLILLFDFDEFNEDIPVNMDNTRKFNCTYIVIRKYDITFKMLIELRKWSLFIILYLHLVSIPLFNNYTFLYMTLLERLSWRQMKKVIGLNVDVAASLQNRKYFHVLNVILLM